MRVRCTCNRGALEYCECEWSLSTCKVLAAYPLPAYIDHCISSWAFRSWGVRWMWGIYEFHREGTAWTVVGASCEGVAMGMAGLDVGRLFDVTALPRALHAMALPRLDRSGRRLPWPPAAQPSAARGTAQVGTLRPKFGSASMRAEPVDCRRTLRGRPAAPGARRGVA